MKQSIYFFLILFGGLIAVFICALLLYFIFSLIFSNNNIQINPNTNNPVNY